MLTIKRPEGLRITDHFQTYEGAKQTWYHGFIQRRAGCGPTTASHLIWYLSRTRQGCEVLTAHDGTQKYGFISLMEDVWKYVTPGFRGVNTTGIFTDGVVRYGRDRGINLSCDVLEIPEDPSTRPDEQTFMNFIDRTIRDDLPVAFLNLHNGDVPGLDTWHWVTLVGFDPVACTARMLDQGRALTIDMRRWFRNTQVGGGLVAARAL